MTKGEAALRLCADSRKTKITQGGYRNVKHALKVMEFDGADVEEVLIGLGYHYEPGKPYVFLTRRAGR